jgi:hypothetical protein
MKGVFIMANKKENVEIQNSHSPELHDDELEAVAGGVTPDMIPNNRYITVSGHVLQENCTKCGNDCWTYDYFEYHPKGHRWHCAVCEAAGLYRAKCIQGAYTASGVVLSLRRNHCACTPGRLIIICALKRCRIGVSRYGVNAD